MPCRAAPPPPPPPHATRELTPALPALSNPLVYRLRTCCLQEFLPRVSLVQTSSLPSRAGPTPTDSFCTSSHADNNTDNSTACSCSPTPASIAVRPRSSPTQLSALFHNHSKHFDTPSFTPPHDNDNEYDASPSQQSELQSSVTLAAALSGWQPSASNIQLSQLQSELAARFMRWALAENVLELESSDCSDAVEAEQLQEYEHAFHAPIDQTLSGHDRRHPLLVPTTTATATAAATSTTTAVSGDPTDIAAQDWAAAFDLVWPEGDYYVAKKTFIREGVAHLKRGRRYIFVEPVLGPAASYLYPKWVDNADEDYEADDDLDESDEQRSTEYEDEGAHVHGQEATQVIDDIDNDSGEHQRHGGNDAAIAYLSADALSVGSILSTMQEEGQDNTSQDDMAGHGQTEEPYQRRMGGQENDNNAQADAGHEDDARDDRAQIGSGSEKVIAVDGERAEKEETDDGGNKDVRGDHPPSNTTNPTLNSSSNSGPSPSSPSPPSSASSSIHGDDSQQHQHTRSYEPLEPYSPLLDPSTDGQDQFEYGLYELQFIPKIQHLLPHQFLPTRQSFIVHLDEDRPTLASPVPSHSKRSECRCQLMMRKVLMQRDLLQVWPPIAPVRTLQEKQQEAEEEARMLEIRQKVQMQTVNWRKTLMTQLVAYG
ncbi:hypothetical protein BGZ68_008086 [Mortierella alpina]|nr:hypothetical protein BGZ68_008086 [Mortierella alpina]